MSIFGQESIPSCAQDLLNKNQTPEQDPALAKFQNYLPMDARFRHDFARLIKEMRAASVFVIENARPDCKYLSDSDASALFLVLDELGYQNLSFCHKGKTFLVMQGLFRFTEVVIKIAWIANSEFDKCPCAREADFYLDVLGEYGKIYRPRYSAFDENSSSADILSLQIGAYRFSVATTQKMEFLLTEKFKEIAFQAQCAPLCSCTSDITELLYQVLKVYREVHTRNIALLSDPRKLMLHVCQDGHGCSAVSRVNFNGQSCAIVVVSAAYYQKQGVLYHEIDCTINQGTGCSCHGHSDASCKSHGSALSRTKFSSLQRAGLVSGFDISHFFAEQKDLSRIGSVLDEKQNITAVNHKRNVSAQRADLQLIAAVFLEILKGNLSLTDSKATCHINLVDEKYVDLDWAAFELFTRLHDNSCMTRPSITKESKSSERFIAKKIDLSDSYQERYDKLQSKDKDLLKLLWRLQASENMTVTSALQNKLFESIQKYDELLDDPFRHNDVPDWNLIPYIIIQSFWRRTLSRNIIPRCQHYYVQGGPYCAGGDKVLQLKPVWLIYECIGEMTGYNAWQRTVRLAEDGEKSDLVGIYVAPIVFGFGPYINFLDTRWCFGIKSSENLAFNGKTCGFCNPKIAVERQQIGGYINSSKDRNGINHLDSSRCDLKRKSRGIPHGQNCHPFYVHGWGRRISMDTLLSKPWLCTVGFELKFKQPRYTELAYSYDWNKQHITFLTSFMKNTERAPTIRLQSRSKSGK